MAHASDLSILTAAGWDDAGLLDELRTGPDPDGALRRMADLGRRHPDALAAAVRDGTLGRRLVRLAGGSRALTAAVALSSDPIGVLDGPLGDLGDGDGDGLGSAVKLALARIAAADLAGDIDMPQAGRLVSAVADQAARRALKDVAGDTPRIAVIALGKWGGQELNYASDIDLVFVHGGDDSEATAIATGLIERLTGSDGGTPAFRVDVDLRPEGASGPVTRSLESYRAYWDRWAETWELQALLRARPVAGDRSLGSRFIEAAAAFVFPERLGADAVRSVRAMKARAEGLVDGAAAELKRGIGGIRDIEFAVQLLQLVHGRADPSIRSANTLDALERLSAGGYVLADDAVTLGDAYRWLRDAEHRVQLFELRQTHTLPRDAGPRERIARALGYRDGAGGGALDLFDADLARRRATVRSIHEQLFHRPVLDAIAESRAGALTPEAAATRLEAFGFVDTEATRQALAELTTGLSRRSRLMRHMLPLIIEWLSLAPDPDLGLGQLRRLVGDSGDSGTLLATLRDDPVASERLCTALGTSRLVARLLDRLPPLVPSFGDDEALARWPEPTELRAEALSRIGVASDPGTAIHAFHAEHLLMVAIADLTGAIDVDDVGRRLSDVADATVSAAARLASDGDEPPFGLVALGKWGGRELHYASDLDAVIVIGDQADPERASQVVEGTIGILAQGRAGFRSLDLDLDLRPEGRKGALVRSVGGYRTYWSQWAGTWELQAMLRARPAAGQRDLAAELVDASSEHVFAPRATLLSDIRTMKARVETERIPLGEDPLFHLKLGKGSISDIEWTVQLIQMQHGGLHPEIRSASTLQGLAAIVESGLLDEDDGALLADTYRFCSRVRNRLFLRTGRFANSMPTDPEEATRLARSLGYTLHPRSAIREEYRRTTRRARRVVDRVFYGLDRPGA